MSKQLSIPQVQKEAERLLAIFDEFCGANDLQYFAAYGTLLGAVRHNGPIPWDDDVDVLMPRPDYDRFIELYRSRTDNDTKVFAPGDANYPIHFVKFVSSRTKMVESGVHFPEDYGVFIDVFPLDGLPERMPGLHLRCIDVVHRLFQASYHQKLPSTRPLPLQAQARRVVGFLGRIIPRHAYLGFLERAMRKHSYQDATHVAMLLSYLPISTEAFSKDELEGESRIPYGEMQVRAFRDPIPVLKRNYGSTWQTPIEREFSSHGIATWKE